VRRVLIVNPFASAVTEERTEAVALALGSPEVRRTERRGHATELAREAGRLEALYVFSGDGGFNEVLNGVDPEKTRKGKPKPIWKLPKKKSSFMRT
jgi:diacylglycerol kinase family enzyme